MAAGRGAGQASVRLGLEEGLDFLREGSRSSPPLVCRFIEEMRADVYALESICTFLRGQGLHVAERICRARKIRLPALHTIEDAGVTAALQALKAQETKGWPPPEIIYWRRKMTAWLRRNSFPEVSKHTVDRLMRDERMNGLIRGRKTRTTIPGKDGRRVGDRLNRDFSAPAMNLVWSPTLPKSLSTPGSTLRPWSLTSACGPSWGGRLQRSRPPPYWNSACGR